jgi:hypothetical protein
LGSFFQPNIVTITVLIWGKAMRKTYLAPLITLFIIFLWFAGCSGGGGGGSTQSGWNMSRPPETNITPQPGEYTFSQEGCFSVSADGGNVVFARDCFRSDSIPIVNGSFAYTHGEIGGTDCPTDSYSISGSFTDTNTASGKISYATNCQITQNSLAFTATKK